MSKRRESELERVTRERDAWRDRFRAIVGENQPDSAGNAVLSLRARAEKAEAERDASRKLLQTCARVARRQDVSRPEYDEAWSVLAPLLNERDELRAAHAEGKAEGWNEAIEAAAREAGAWIQGTRCEWEADCPLSERIRALTKPAGGESKNRTGEKT